MKGILLIIDGLGDLPIPSLGDRTPLEAAHTPVLDGFAGQGRYGMIDPIGPGVLPNTHSGAGLLLGVLPTQISRLQRGPVEAAGLGLQMQAGDVALRANFATLEAADGGWRVIDRRAGRIREGTEELGAALGNIHLGDGVSVRFRPTEQHRGVLVFSGPGLDPRVSDTDPGDHGASPLAMASLALDPAAEDTAALINRYLALAREVLEAHPVNRARASDGLPAANGLVVRGAGSPLLLDSLVSERGLRASVVSGCNTVKGLGRLLGFRIVEDARFTADLDTHLEAKISTALSELQDTDLVFVHIKAPDICSHDRNPVAKRDFLVRIDQALQPVAAHDLALGIAADHTTDSNTGMHTADPVPALIHVAGNGVAPPSASVNFSERACRHGNLTRYDSHHFLQALLRRMTGPD